MDNDSTGRVVTITLHRIASKSEGKATFVVVNAGDVIVIETEDTTGKQLGKEKITVV
jgi:hypothetical protein